MSSLISDVVTGAMTPETVNAACNATGKLLKMVELEHKFLTNPERPARDMTVAFESRTDRPLVGSGNAVEARA
jgi:hypothetical protein